MIFSKKLRKSVIFELFFVIVFASIFTYLSNYLVLKLYFWRDDWHNFWGTATNSFNYMDSYLWIYERGLIAPLLYHFYKVTDNYLIWQWAGLIIKMVNVVLVYYFIRTITKSKRTSVYGMLFYAAYSGGLEDYSWVRQNGLAITFLLILFIFLQYFLEKENNKKLILYSFVSWLVLLLFFGQGIFFSRISAMLLVYLFWIFVYKYKKLGADRFKNFMKKNIVVISVISLVVIGGFGYLMLWAMKSRGLSMVVFFKQVFIDRNIYLGDVGSLISNPYYYTPEWGGLAGTYDVNVWVGFVSLIMLLCCAVFLLKYKHQTCALLTLSLLWIHVAFIVNWLFGGGGTKTIIGSSHRYLAVSAIGVVLLTAEILSKIPRKYATLLLAGLLFLSYRYTKRIYNGDFWIRGQPIVGHFYSTIAYGVPDGERARLILVEAPDELRAPVVNWSLPWAYAYYKKLDISDFPVIFSRTDDAVSWICSDETGRSELEKMLGVTDNRKGEQLLLNEIYTWKLDPNGNLFNRTDSFRNRVHKCLEENARI